MASSGKLRRVALVRTDVSEELSASIIGATRIGELGTLAVTSNPPKCQFLQGPHGVTTQKTPFFWGEIFAHFHPVTVKHHSGTDCLAHDDESFVNNPP
jgi:hypothetical protein